MKAKREKRGGHRMKQLGRKCVVVWFAADQHRNLDLAAAHVGLPMAAFVRKASMIYATKFLTGAKPT